MAKLRQTVISSSVQIGGGITAALVPVSFIPVVGVVIAGVTLALMLLFNRKSGQQKIAASQFADEAEQLLKQNLNAYFDLPAPRSKTNQDAALHNFTIAWEALTSPEFCGDPNLGTAGQKCISERQRGGSAPWCPTTTGCDWFALYYDPIAADVAVDDSAGAALANFLNMPEEGMNLLIPAAMITLALLL